MQRTSSRAAWLVLPISLVAATLVMAAADTAMAQDGAATAQDESSSDPWGILDGTYRPPQGTQPPPAPEFVYQSQTSTSSEWAALEETYRQCLDRLGEEKRTALLKVVADLEVAAIADQPERRMQRLGKMQLDVARQLASQDPEILVPVFQLHHDLYLEHRRARQWYLLLHSVSMVRELAALYVKEGGSTGTQMTAARVLVSLAGHLQAGQQPASVQLFEEVLVLDPGHESAYLGLAAHYEKRGGPFEPVVRHLKNLLAVHPEHREGRLRLGINLLRLEKRDAAKPLRELLEEPERDWVYRLAAQELARFEASQGRLDEAIRILEEAVEQADDQKLQIQLSFLYDRNRQSYNSQRMAEKASQGAPALEAPRGRYNTWPKESLEHDREELRRLAASRAQLLARLLGYRAPAKTVREEINP